MSLYQKTIRNVNISHDEYPTSLTIPWKVIIDGFSHKGDIVISKNWSPHLTALPRTVYPTFRIVILETPYSFQSNSITDSRIAAWTP